MPKIENRKKTEGRKPKGEKMPHAKGVKGGEVEGAKRRELPPMLTVAMTAEGVMLLTEMEFEVWQLWRLVVAAHAERMRRRQ